jgi:hypothetical protein
VEYNGAEWNKYFVPLFVNFKNKMNEIDGKWWYEIKFISSYFITFHYYFSNSNNRILLYSISLRSISFYFINPNSTVNQNIHISSMIWYVAVKEEIKKYYEWEYCQTLKI